MASSEKNFAKFKDVTLKQLFDGFFEYYHNYPEKNFRVQITSCKDCPKLDESYVFDIEDPFDHKHNPGDRPNPQNYRDDIEEIRKRFGIAYDYVCKQAYNLLFSPLNK